MEEFEMVKTQLLTQIDVNRKPTECYSPSMRIRKVVSLFAYYKQIYYIRIAYERYEVA